MIESENKNHGADEDDDDEDNSDDEDDADEDDSDDEDDDNEDDGDDDEDDGDDDEDDDNDEYDDDERGQRGDRDSYLRSPGVNPSNSRENLDIELTLETVLGLPLTSSDSTSKDIHHAVLTCVLHDDKGKLYGLTCGHVTQSSDGKIIDHNGEVFGACLMMKQNVKLQPDVGTFELNDTRKLPLFKNLSYDLNGILKPCRFFAGSINELYDQTVYKCVYLDERGRGLTKNGTPIEGKIASAEIHKCHRDIVGGHSFLIAACNTSNGERTEGEITGFSVKGESGTPLAIREDDDTVTLVGSITGQADLLDSEQRTVHYVICAFLPAALKCLEREHKTPFYFPIHLLDSRTRGHDMADNAPQIVTCGESIYLKTMEKVSPSDFDIADRLCYMTAIEFGDEPSSYMPLIRTYETSLRHTVFSRGSINFPAIYYPDSAEQRSMLLGYLCVQALYASQPKQGRVLLKAAMHTLGKATDSTIHILSKFITFATFLYFLTEENDKAISVFEAGVDFYESNKNNSNFPRESYGFLYYNYSKYFLRMGNRDKAVEMGIQCHDIVKSVYEQKQMLADNDPENTAARTHANDFYNRYINAVCKLTNTLLWCGETFQKKYRKVSVPQADVSWSEELLKGIAPRVETAPPVQKVEYLLAKCNLLYRQGNYGEALVCSEECSVMSSVNHLSNELLLAQKRRRVLVKITATASQST